MKKGKNYLKPENQLLKLKSKNFKKLFSLLKFKCWYYETAMKDGNEDAINAMLPDKLPENIQKLYNEVINNFYCPKTIRNNNLMLK